MNSLSFQRLFWTVIDTSDIAFLTQLCHGSASERLCAHGAHFWIVGKHSQQQDAHSHVTIIASATVDNTSGITALALTTTVVTAALTAPPEP